MKTTYVAGWNQPGYLPEMDPAHLDSFDDAKRYIIDSIKCHEAEYGFDEQEDVAEELCHLAEDINLLDRPFEVLAVDGWVYWVMENVR